MEFCVRFTFIRFFLADSMPLRMACGTSLALPEPKPTTPAAGSPTTTSAANDMFLPPLTTLVTRLMATTSSFNCSEPASILGFFVITGIRIQFLKLQSGFARRVRQRLDPPVIDVAAAVKHHLADTFGLGPFGNGLADLFCGSHVASHLFRAFAFLGAGAHDGLARHIVNQLHVYVVE